VGFTVLISTRFCDWRFPWYNRQGLAGYEKGIVMSNKKKKQLTRSEQAKKETLFEIQEYPLVGVYPEIETR
jgi:hypothetical protein